MFKGVAQKFNDWKRNRSIDVVDIGSTIRRDSEEQQQKPTIVLAIDDAKGKVIVTEVAEVEPTPEETVEEVDENIVKTIHGHHIKDADEYFMPRKLEGIPVFETDYIFSKHEKEVGEIKKALSIGSHRMLGDKSLEVILIDEVIKRFIDYVHMLPASESYHHAYKGGLIAHSLVVARDAILNAKDRKPPSTGFIEIDAELRPKYLYATFIGGLIHDMGKLSSDITVSPYIIIDEATGETRHFHPRDGVPNWHPKKESLIAWATRWKVSSYTMVYRSRANGAHNYDTVEFLRQVVGIEYAQDYLTHDHRNLYDELAGQLSHLSRSKHYIATQIHAADAHSVFQDVGKRMDINIGIQKESVYKKCLDVLLHISCDWDVNKPNAKIWVVGNNVYLRYTAAFDEIRVKGIEKHYELPNSTNAIIQEMRHGRIVEILADDKPGYNFFPGVYTEKDIRALLAGDLVVKAEHLIKLTWSSWLYREILPPSCAGVMMSPLDEDRVYYYDEQGDPHEFLTKVPDNQAPQGHTIEGQVVDNAQQAIPADAPMADEPPPPTEDDYAQMDMVNTSEGDSAASTSQEQSQEQTAQDKKAAKSPRPKKPKTKPVATKSKLKEFMLSQKNTTNDELASLVLVSAAEEEEQEKAENDTQSSGTSETDNVTQANSAPSDTEQTEAQQDAQAHSQQSSGEDKPESVTVTDSNAPCSQTVSTKATSNDKADSAHATTSSQTDNTPNKKPKESAHQQRLAHVYEHAHIKVKGDKNYVSIESIKTLFELETDKDAIAKLMQDNIAILNDTKSVMMEPIRIDGHTRKFIRIHSRRGKGKKHTSSVGKSTNTPNETDTRKQFAKTMNERSDKRAQQAQKREQRQKQNKHNTEQAADALAQEHATHANQQAPAPLDDIAFSLAAGIVHAKAHSLAFVIKTAIEQHRTNIDLQGDAVHFSAHEMEQMAHKVCGKKVRFRHLKRVLSQNPQFEKVSNGSDGLRYQLPINQLNNIDLSEVLS